MLTAPSSAEHKTGFAQTSKGWLQRWHTDRRLNANSKALCTQIYLSFNKVHFERTGELLAWPSWNTLMATTGLCRTSVFLGLRHLEWLGALEIEHGRYDHQTKRRAGNQYRAREGKVHPIEPCTKVQNQGSPNKLDSFESDSVNLKRKNQVFGLPRKEGKTESEEEKRKRWEAEGKSPFTGCPIWKRATP